MPGAGHVTAPPGPAVLPRKSPTPARPPLVCKVLPVEDEYLIACDTAKLLHEASAEVVGPVGRLVQAPPVASPPAASQTDRRAMALAAREPRLDDAVLDV